MLDIRLIRSEPESVRRALSRRGEAAAIDELLALDARRRELITQAEQLKARQNQASEEISRIKKAGGDASGIIAEMKDISA